MKVSRKRLANGGSLATRKRRLCLGEKRDTAPLLSMLPTSKTFTVKQVEEQVKSLLQSLCEVGHLVELQYILTTQTNYHNIIKPWKLSTDVYYNTDCNIKSRSNCHNFNIIL